MNAKLTIGSRASKLALWQTNWVKAELEKRYPQLAVEIKTFSTKGDRVLDVSLPKLGAQGKGLFTQELEEAMLAGDIDLAVHSLKDLPTELPAGLTLGAICEREDVRDALVARHDDSGNPFATLAALPAGARVGTSSLRREAQLRALRPDVRVLPVRGNLDTRLRKLDDGDYDAILLAAAGLLRLGYSERISAYLNLQQMLCAVGQGALAIETRAADERIAPLVAALDHQETRLACTAERAFLQGLGGGCLVPIAAHSRVCDATLTLDGLVAGSDGATIIRGQASAPVATAANARTTAAADLGRQLADDLLRRGAARLLAGVRG